MRTNMVAPSPPDHLTYQAGDAFVKIARQPFGYFSIPCFFPDEVRFETTAENGIHAALPKTWLKVSPGSFPDIKSANR